MIYGQEQAAIYPVADLYDTGVMNMYINAIRGEYERGIKQQEEFISKYGDFISPFQKDVENWDKLTMDPFIEAYNYLEKNGIDPLRSQEGRAVMSNIMRKVPREKLSQLRQSAAAGQEYLKNLGEMQAKGLYNPEFEQFLLGNRTFADQDTLLQGMWSRTSPTEYRGLRTLTDPWFKNRTPKYKYTKDGYDYFGYDVDDMKQVANTQIDAFLANDYGKFYYDRALRLAQSTRSPLETDDQVVNRAKDILMNDIISANNDYLIHNREVNRYAMAELEFQNQLRLAATKRRWNREDAQVAQQQNYSASWTGTLRNSINKNHGERDYNRLRSVLIANRQHNQKIANNKNVSQATRNKAKKLVDYYDRAIENYDNGTAWRSTDKLGNVAPTKAGYKILKEYDARQLNGKRGSAYDAIENSYMNNNVMNISDGISRDKAYDFVAGSNTRSLPGMANTGEKYKYVTIGGNTNLRRARVAKLSGAGLSSGSISRQFNNYLRKNKVVGYVIDNQIGAGLSPRPSGQGANVDFYYDVYIPKSYVEDFAKNVVNNGIDNVETVMSKLGIVEQKVGEKKTGTNKTTDVNMVRVPVTTTSTESSLRAWEDAQMDKTYFGTSNAYNLSLNRQGEAIMQSTQ